jgi:hypothetical protein
MKTIRNIFAVGLFAAASAVLAAGHGGGGFGGGHFGGFGGAHSGARFSFGARPINGQPAFVRSPGRATNSFVSSRPVAPQQSFRAPNVQRSIASTHPNFAPPVNRPMENARNHIVARQDANVHPNWDRRGAHFWNGHWWAWDGGTWLGLEAGFYPWDYFPYYSYDYYPYDYYPGYYTDVEPYYEADGVNGNVPAPDPNVTAVQPDLSKLGYYHGSIDGLYGRATRDAVAHYQTDHQLAVTGTLTTQTLQALGISPAVAS